MEWQDISTAPKDGTHILAFASDEYRQPYYSVAQWAPERPEFGSVAGWFWSFAIRPTHWMPLPPPPTL